MTTTTRRRCFLVMGLWLVSYTHGLVQQQASRRDFTKSIVTAASGGFLATTLFPPSASAAAAAADSSSTAADSTTDPNNVRVFKTGSGLQYIDLKDGSGPEPRYGQLLTIKYSAYMKLPKSNDKQRFESDVTFLLTHGNGRLISGLDEGLHTMKEGGFRRLLIPPKLGFTDSGIGPLPSGFLQRRTLNSLLDEMVAQRGGTLIYDVELLRILDNEADQGYYDDQVVSQEDLNAIRDNFEAQRPPGMAVMPDGAPQV